NFGLGASEIDALVAYLWAQPPQAPTGEGALPTGDSARGQKLFRESRCISCHTVDGRGNGSAPELAGIGSKVDRHWLFAFLGDPHSFQPTTAMPRYAFSRQDLLDLTQYLTDELVDPSLPPPGPAYRPLLSLVEEGEKLYVGYGCGGCHRIAGQRSGAKTGPDLAGIGAKPVELLDFGAREDLPRTLPAWLAAKVAQPRSFREGLKMPAFGFSPVEIQALVTALLSVTPEPIPEEYQVEAVRADYAPAGRFGELVRQYRCLSCHQVREVGGDISTAPLTAEGSKVRRSWLESYLLLPTTIRPILTDRMIPLWLPPEEAAFLADYMENVFLDDGIPGEIFPEGVPPERAERGRRLFFERYGCQACHQVGGTGGYYGPPLDESP
ncbi:MAG: cytochrome c, partial [candidate division NC10 bacterium]|nr:cytochrome c [candidate division NC10 bacterium]